MSNHRWNNNTCIKCGINRTKMTIKLRMAITNYPPYDYYKYESVTVYYKNEISKGQKTRPDCNI